MTHAAKADPGDGMTQAGIASDHASQALLGSGVQNVYFGERDQDAEPTISLAPPFGLRDDKLPIRGRDALLAKLSSPDPTVRVDLVHGLGGCGKTRLALEVAYRAERDGSEVWWVPATEESGFLAAMRSLGRRLGVTDHELRHGDAADLIWQRATARTQPWLLVIDNADEPAILAGAGSSVGEGRGWVRRLPTGATGRVLITSRDGNAETWGTWCQRHRVGMLTDDPGATMLADYAGRYPSLGGDEDARRLTARLGGLPLALKIAGSYLGQSASIPAAFADPGTIGTYRDYLAAIGTVDSTPLTPDEALTLIGQTWDLTLDRLDARRLPEARRLLRLLACFADAPIPYELLLHPATLAESTEFAGITGARLWQALAALDDCGLIDLTRPARPGDIPVLRLHPLVRDTSRQSATDGMPLLAIAANLVNRAAAAPDTRDPEDPSVWPMWRLLAPHAAHVLSTLSALPNCPDEAAQAASYAAFNATRYMASQGLYAAAEGEYRNILTTELRVLGQDHPDTLIARHEIARMIAEQGNHAAAETEYRDIRTTQLRVLGPDHPSTLATRHSVAYEMAEQGNHAAAETEYRDVLRTLLRVRGPDHPSTLITRHEIARMIAAQGNHAAAETEYRDVLRSLLRVRGPDHPSTLITRNEIARMIAEQGNHAAAETEFRDILTTKLRVLGPDHPSTKRTSEWVEYLERRRASDS